ncbi:hypothetical protein [Microbacterium istanbulense]|uniref:WGR domain-containing protein n=1 Tax=Microbacterium istanbulense TaxID=3122049 RepID=A0ABU8LKR8_9MICO
MSVIKTYRRDDEGALHYLEAWRDGGVFTIHEGKVGTKGSTVRKVIRNRTSHYKPTYTEYVATFRERAAAEGYREIPEDEQSWVVLQIWTHSDDLSHPDDASAFADAAGLLDEQLGWWGVGHCDGSDVGGEPPAGSGSDGTVLNFFCPVVDVPIGVAALRRVARQLKLSQRWVIGARDPGDESEYYLAYSSRKRDREFAL